MQRPRHVPSSLAATIPTHTDAATLGHHQVPPPTATGHHAPPIPEGRTNTTRKAVQGRLGSAMRSVVRQVHNHCRWTAQTTMDEHWRRHGPGTLVAPSSHHRQKLHLIYRSSSCRLAQRSHWKSPTSAELPSRCKGRQTWVLSCSAHYFERLGLKLVWSPLSSPWDSQLQLR